MKTRHLTLAVAVPLGTLAPHLLTGCAHNVPSVMDSMANDEFCQAHDGPEESYRRRHR